MSTERTFSASSSALAGSLVYVVAYANVTKVMAATGFTIRHEQRLFLVTSWHLFSGRCPQTLQVLHPHRVVPDSCCHSCLTSLPVRSPMMSSAGFRVFLANTIGWLCEKHSSADGSVS